MIFCIAGRLLSLLLTGVTRDVMMIDDLGHLLAQTKSLVRDEGAEQALVEPLVPIYINFQSSWPRFTLLTELNQAFV